VHAPSITASAVHTISLITTTPLERMVLFVLVGSVEPVDGQRIIGLLDAARDGLASRWS
jgi:hypothetical protein